MGSFVCETSLELNLSLPRRRWEEKADGGDDARLGPGVQASNRGDSWVR